MSTTPDTLGDLIDLLPQQAVSAGQAIAEGELTRYRPIAAFLHRDDRELLLWVNQCETLGAVRLDRTTIAEIARNEVDLEKRNLATYEFMSRDTKLLLVAVRFPAPFQSLTAGMIFPREEVAPNEIVRYDYVHPLLALCFAKYGLEMLTDLESEQTRNAQLRAEDRALRASQTEAFNAAIIDREARINEHAALATRLMALMEFAADAIITTDQDGSIESYNASAEKLLGHPAMEITRTDIRELFSLPGEDAGLSFEQWGRKHFRDSFEKGAAVEVLAVHKDAGMRPVEVTVSVVGDVHTFILRDIRERKQQEGLMLQSQKLEAIGQLAAGIAHEINTPTQYIGDNLYFLKDFFGDFLRLIESLRKIREAAAEASIAGDLIAESDAIAEEMQLDYVTPQIENALDQALHGVEQVGTIVHSMKEFAHPGSDKSVSFDINKCIENTLVVCKNAWKYVATVEANLGKNMGRVPGHPEEVNQVFLNLIVNAAHAIEDKQKKTGDKGKGCITITSSMNGEWVEVRVRDTGAGIANKDSLKVFDPFFTTKKVGRGTGQGLAIVHRVVTKHGGTITFESEVGKGTEFLLRFPTRTDQDQEKGATS